jgi:ATPase subunit of ABC transporter with duplicated ATPase domains
VIRLAEKTQGQRVLVVFLRFQFLLFRFSDVVGSTVVMEGNGIIEQYAGGYDDYLLQKQDALNKTGKTKTKQSKKADDTPKKKQGTKYASLGERSKVRKFISPKMR